MRKKSAAFFPKAKCSAFFAAGFAMFAFNAPAWAADIDPFQFDTSQWESFSHYTDNANRGKTETVKAIEAQAAAQVSPPAAAAPEAAAPAAEKSTASAATVAAPTRALFLPVMPGVNKGYQVQVDSTEDEAARQIAQIADMESQPTIKLPEHNWQDAAEAAHRDAQADDNDDGDAQKPLHIRMTFLPNLQIRPEPPPLPETNHGRAPNAAAAALSTPVPDAPKKSPSEVAACAALDAYKQQQLQAIQSDRQTLAALQKAISSLGLQKQLSFMSGAQGSVSAQADNAPGGMDMPAARP